MNGSSRFIVTVTDGRMYVCLLFTKETASKLHSQCRAFSFDEQVHYRVNMPRLRKRFAKLLREDGRNESLRRLCGFFNASPDKCYFAVSGGDIAGSRLFIQIYKTLARLNHRDPPPGADQRFRLLSSYDFTSVGMVVRKAGQVVKTKRRCRYCGRSFPDTTFDSKAHTISEALGNKTLYTNDECDLCNTRFCTGIEAQFINRLSPLFPILDLSGKNGGRKVKGKHYSISRQEDRGRKKPLLIAFSEGSVSPRGGINVTDVEIRASGSARAWVPQNIYRFLCKFVMGTLDPRLLRYFRKTIQWIQGSTFKPPLPKVCIEHLENTVQQPVVYIYRRINNENLRPYMFARVHMLNSAYTFIIPYCSLDVEGLNHDGFLTGVTGLVPSARREWLNLNSTRKITPEIVTYLISGDHNIVCDIDDGTRSRWYAEQEASAVETDEELIYTPSFRARTAI